MITNWHLERHKWGVWSQRDAGVAFQNFSWNPRKSAGMLLTPWLPLFWLSCLRTSVEAGRDISVEDGDIRGWLVFPTASPSKLISNPSFTGAALCLFSRSSSNVSSLKTPGEYKSGFQRYLDAKNPEVSSKISYLLKQRGERHLMENANCGGNSIKFCWVSGSIGGTEVAVTDCCYSHTKSAANLRSEASSIKSWSRSANCTTLPLVRLPIITFPWLWTRRPSNRWKPVVWLSQ